jgi:hypothetical protein
VYRPITAANIGADQKSFDVFLAVSDGANSYHEGRSINAFAA